MLPQMLRHSNAAWTIRSSHQAGIEATCFQQGLSANSNAATKTKTAQFTGATSTISKGYQLSKSLQTAVYLCLFYPQPL